MKRISNIGSLLKKIYRLYSSSILKSLKDKGFTDLRPSFLEVLLYICENSGGPTIKDIGNACGLKKQTMTSHLNELESRDYILRRPNLHDKREQNVFLTESGEKFKLILFESIKEIENDFGNKIGNVELDRIQSVLENLYLQLENHNQLQERFLT